jgi:hypothetical protein
MRRTPGQGRRPSSLALREGDHVRLPDGNAATVESLWMRGYVEWARVMVDGIHTELRADKLQRIPRSVASEGAVDMAVFAELSEPAPVEEPQPRFCMRTVIERTYSVGDGSSSR